MSDLSPLEDQHLTSISSEITVLNTPRGISDS